jgi:hypothetical protein
MTNGQHSLPRTGTDPDASAITAAVARPQEGKPVTVLFFAAASLLVGAAIARKGDWCPAVLAICLAASMLVAAMQPASHLPFIAAIDAMCCLAMAALWTAYNSMRCWSVGLIGLAKTGATLAAYLVDPLHVSLAYALFVNAAFLLQVVVSGGWADGVGSRLDRVFARLAPRRHGLLRNGAR